MGGGDGALAHFGQQLRGQPGAFRLHRCEHRGDAAFLHAIEHLQQNLHVERIENHCGIAWLHRLVDLHQPGPIFRLVMFAAGFHRFQTGLQGAELLHTLVEALGRSGKLGFPLFQRARFRIERFTPLAQIQQDGTLSIADGWNVRRPGSRVGRLRGRIGDRRQRCGCRRHRRAGGVAWLRMVLAARRWQAGPASAAAASTSMTVFTSSKADIATIVAGKSRGRSRRISAHSSQGA